jgi:hypothetical protein
MKLSELLFEAIQRTKVHTSEGLVNRLALPGGHLDYEEEDGAFMLMIVEVDEASRNQKIATALVKEFLSIVNKAGGYLSTTGFLDDGEVYLKHVIKRLRPSFPKIEWDEDSFE